MDLKGWDTAFAIELALANQALARGKDKLLVDFVVDDPDHLPIKATGSFGNWQIVEGGSGEFVYLKLPILSGQFTQADRPAVDLAGTALVAQVALDLIPSTDQKVQDLRFNVSVAGEVGQPPKPGAITPIRIDDPDRRLDDVQAALLMVGLANFVASHADRISFIFATINLVPPQTDSWLAPVKSAFVYADGASEGGGSLVILSVTTPREIGNLPRQIDPALLSGNYQAAFAFSRKLFLQYVIMPSLPAVFGHGASESSFTFNSAEAKIENTRSLEMDSVRSGAIDYYPRIDRLRMRIDNAALAGEYSGYCDLKAGISMTFWVNPSNKITYDAATKSLSFLADGNAPNGHDADIPWYWWFLGPVVRLIVEIVVRTIAQSLAGSLTTKVGAMVSPAKNPPTSIQWRDTANLNVGAAEVAGDFIMWGDFTA
jgi:hypothetical protein